METTSRDAVLKSLCSLRLMEYDWDGAGGLPLRGDVADTVHDLYAEFETDPYNNLPIPVVILNGNGTIEIAYDAPDGRKLFLTCECLGVITYIRIFEDDQTTIEGTIRLGNPYTSYEDDHAELNELFHWISE